MKQFPDWGPMDFRHNHSDLVSRTFARLL